MRDKCATAKRQKLATVFLYRAKYFRPRSYWDDWMRLPEQRKNRACIRPEVGRSKTFGKIGVSNGLFFDKHLKFIQVSPS